MLYFSFIFPFTKKDIHWSNKRRVKLEKNIQGNIHGGHAFSLLDFLRINKPFC